MPFRFPPLQLTILLGGLIIALLILGGGNNLWAADSSIQITQPVSAGPVCNNNGICEAGETTNNCPNDCGGLVGGRPPAPPPPPAPPAVPNVINFQAVYNQSAQQIDLSWINPIFAEFGAVRIMRLINPAIPASPFDGQLIYDGSGEAAVDTTITAGTTYNYVAFVRTNETPPRYSSGALAQVTAGAPALPLPPPPPPGPPTPPTTPPSPFDQYPQAVSTNPQIARLSLGDFKFIQISEPIKFFSAGAAVTIKGTKDLTISIDYDRLPEDLKIIGFTIFDPLVKDQQFSFLLRVNPEKTAYAATLAPFAKAGTYPFRIYIINYQDRTIKTLVGSLIVVGAKPPGVLGTLAAKGLVPLAVTSGLLAGLLQTLLLTSRAHSFFDFYLIVIRSLGSLLGSLGLRKKRTPWGTVYDAVTKRPLDPAYVSLQQNNKEVASAITDLDGRYGFFVPPGLYTIEPGKTHYRFPSTVLLGKTEDELYASLYFGEPFTTAAGEIINRNMPMDAIGFDWNEFMKDKQRFFKLYSRREVFQERIFRLLFIVGLVTAAGTMLFTPSLVNLAILVLYLVLLFGQIFWRVAHPIVALKNKLTGEPYSFAVVKVWLSTLPTGGSGTDQLIKKVVADELGRFYVLVPPGDYYLTVEEKLADQSYQRIYQSAVLKLKKGVVTSDILI